MGNVVQADEATDSSASQTIALDDGAMKQLREESRELLDTIDRLRELRVNEFVDLPQLIVVGDQSSGKSSVLEAISRVRFPVKDGVCTRFATELILRKSPNELAEVCIRKSNGEDDTSFTRPSPGFRRDELPSIIEDAKRHLGGGTEGSGFSEDVLRIKIQGPDLPSLTLVDLPGFYHGESEDQSAEGRDIVKRLVNRYMSQKNSIILAIVAADVEFARQAGLTEARLHDPGRQRTMGIITKPDRVSSANSSRFVKLANNQETKHTLELGWHVLRNRADGEEEVNDDERDANETTFFADSPVWSKVKRADLGITLLRKKLGSKLRKHIENNLGGVVEDIRRNLRSRESRLAALGQPRSSPADIRRYLSAISAEFTALIIDALNGRYSNIHFFGSSMKPRPHSGVEKLRANIRLQGRAFVLIMQHVGASFRLKLDNTEHDGSQTFHCHASLEPFVKHLSAAHGFGRPAEIPAKDFKTLLDLVMAGNVGTQFPGYVDLNVAYEIFQHWSQRWEHIASCHIRIVTDTAKEFVWQLLNYTVADEHTRTNIWRACMESFFEDREKDLTKKLGELLQQCQRGYPLQIDSEFQAAIALRRESRTEKIQNDEELVFWEVFDNMMTYYDLSLRSFTENVMILALENCLIRHLHELFDAKVIGGFSDAQLTEVAAERADIRKERKKLKKEIRILSKGLDECRRHASHMPSSATRGDPMVAESAASLASVPIIAPAKGTNSGSEVPMGVGDLASFFARFAQPGPEKPSKIPNASLPPTPLSTPPRPPFRATPGSASSSETEGEAAPSAPLPTGDDMPYESLFGPPMMSSASKSSKKRQKYSSKTMALRAAYHGKEGEF